MNAAVLGAGGKAAVDVGLGSIIAQALAPMAPLLGLVGYEYLTAEDKEKVAKKLPKRFKKKGGKRRMPRRGRKKRTATRSRFRGPGTRTKTKTRRKRKYSQIQKAVATAVRSQSRKIAKKARQSDEQAFKHSTTYVYTGTANQKGNIFRSFLHGQDFNSGVDQEIPGVLQIVNQTLPEINGAVVSYKDLSDANATSYINTLWGYLKMEIVNNYAYPVRVEYYHVYCSDNCADTKTPITDWKDWLGKYSTNTAGTLKTTSDVSPFNSIGQEKKFLSHWKLGKKQTVVLQPGTGMTILHKPPRKRGFSLQEQRQHGVDFQKGFSSGVVLQMLGGVSHGTVADTEAANVGYADFKLDIVETREWRYNVYNYNFIPRREEDDNYDALTNPENMNIVGGLATDVDEDVVP